MNKEEEFKYLISRHPELVSLIRLILISQVPGPATTDQRQKTDD